MDLITLAGGEPRLTMGPRQISLATRIPLEEVMEDLNYLLSPDVHSATPDHDGKRLIPLVESNLNAGFYIVNLDKHKMVSPERERARKRRWAAKKREEDRATRVNIITDNVTVLESKRPNQGG